MRIIGNALRTIRNGWRPVGNIYFWLVLGSIPVALYVGRMSSIHRSQPDADVVSQERDDAPVEPTPFEDGFMTAFGLVVFWGLLYLLYEQQHPRWSGKLRAPVMDYESGQLVVPTLCVAEGSKTPWVACVRETKSGRNVQVELDARIPRRHDLDYDGEIHIVPYKGTEEHGRFGVHDFTQTCCCCPEVMEQVNGRTLVWHSERLQRDGDC